jgi:ATPase subunit of ABC transporter with duplicated ATPase domains
MITISNLALTFGSKKLFEDVNLKFTTGNCYGVIGANGAGKSTFLKILSGELEPQKGNVGINPGQRMAVLKQDHYEFDNFNVRETVIMGHQRLYQIMQEKNSIYLKSDFSDADGLKAAELEGEFAELSGWEAESDAEKILSGLGIPQDFIDKKMADIPATDKVKVLLAQALFGNPHILLMDEPTNHLDFKALAWLEEFLINYHNTVILVSHDRHFLNKVCTHMVDIDYGHINMIVGNYDFWYDSSQLALKLLKDQNKKKEEKVAELQAFIARFGSNASKAKQATSRKKLLDKITIDTIRPSTRRYPFVGFKPDREAGKEILFVTNLSKSIDGVKVLNDISFVVNKEDKIVFLSRNEGAASLLFDVLAGQITPDSGEFRWGTTISLSYLPKDSAAEFANIDMSLLDWMRQFAKAADQQDETFLRGFLGKMLFSGDEALKSVKVLSGGEKVRALFSMMMLSGANLMLLDEPTNHLDLESIQSVNDGLAAFKGNIMFTSHDHKFVDTIANRIIELTPQGIVDKIMTLDEYMEDEKLQAAIDMMYQS